MVVVLVLCAVVTDVDKLVTRSMQRESDAMRKPAALRAVE